MRVLCVSLLLLFCLCTGNRYDGEIVVLSNGEVVQLQYNVGNSYFIRPLRDSNVLHAAEQINK